MTDRPRIAPGTRAELGRINWALVRLLGAATGGGPPNVFTTIAKHPGLFRKWLRFAGALMPGGRLPRADSELVILRVAHNCACAYERDHHERLGAEAGLSTADIARVRDGAQAPGWSPRAALLLRAADELHASRTLSDDLWTQLSATLSEVQLIELCMLIGHYEMLAMTLNALRVQIDGPPSAKGPPRAVRMLRRLVER